MLIDNKKLNNVKWRYDLHMIFNRKLHYYYMKETKRNKSMTHISKTCHTKITISHKITTQPQKTKKITQPHKKKTMHKYSKS